jgi:SAM-dependent methyltransferase
VATHDSRCTVCQSDAARPLLAIEDVPAHCNLLWPTREEARSAPRGDIRLCFCPECGHLFNAAFDPRRMAYTQAYDNSLHFSPLFQQYAATLAQELVERHDLRGKEVVEIGSGQGDFLRLLCELGGNRGTGFDASYVPDPSKELGGRVRFVQEFYSDQHARQTADFICCRHVLEHIERPDAFVAMVRRSLGNRQTAVFFEVPDVRYTLRDLGIWDIIYEHCSYFSRPSLARLFEQNGFQVQRLAGVFNGQFLTIEATPATPTTAAGEQRPEIAEMAKLAAAFAGNYRQKVGKWQRRLADMAGRGQRVVIWGTGSKGVTFLNTVKAAPLIAYAVDINPRKQGGYVAGSGQQIVPPDFLVSYRPDTVIIMNRNYEAEIGRQLAALDVPATIVAA